MPGTATNIFVSYGRADSQPLAIRLRDDLQAMGYSVWLDLDDIAGGANWSKKIEDAIAHCHVMLALMSPHSYQSQWCRAEQLRATRMGKRIIPLYVIPGTDVPLHLEHLNYLDFSTTQQYDDKFRDLLSDITAGAAFQQPGSEQKMHGTRSPFKKSRQHPRANYRDEKRTAPAFRRYLQDLRQEEWLGARFWWPYFLFYFADIHHLTSILKAGELRSPFAQGKKIQTRFEKNVRLYFRPRTPDLFRYEGFRPAAPNLPAEYAPMPVYLLFDLEAVICQPDVLFAEGDPLKVKKTYKTASYFRTMPFEQIYHDSWFSADEREEIMRFREAQVLIPDRIGLESLQLIWMRSPAEYETLRQLMPEELWQQWSDKITARSDYHLFNNKRAFVQEAVLQAGEIRLRFNPCQNGNQCGAFHAKAVVTFTDGAQIEWEDKRYEPEADLVIRLSRKDPYQVRFLLDETVAYIGQYQNQNAIL